MNKNSFLPHIISSIPNFVKSEYPKFLKFIEYYYQFLEEEGNWNDILGNFYDRFNSISDPYKNRILRDLGFDKGENFEIPVHHLIFFLKQFYLSRGNLDSFKFLFRLFFNEKVDLKFPREKIAFASSVSPSYSIRAFSTASSFGSKTYEKLIKGKTNFSDLFITGTRSKISTTVNHLVEFSHGNDHFLFFLIDEPQMPFIKDEPIYISDGKETITETIIPQGILQIIEGGIGYKENELIFVQNSIPDNQIFGGLFRITRVQRGHIDGIQIINGGSGYSKGDVIKTITSSDQGSGFLAVVSKVDNSGAIQEIQILDKGWNYKVIPSFSIKTSTGTGALLKPITYNIGKIQEIETIQPLVLKDISQGTNTINILTDSGTNAVLNIDYVSKTNSPFILNDRSILGGSCVLTDSYIYQQFSYQLQSSIPSDTYNSFIDFLHPIGFQRFDNLLIEDSSTYTIRDVKDFFRYFFHITSNHRFYISQTSKILLEHLIYDVPLRIRSLSINNLDDSFKFSNNFTYSPVELNYPVIDSIENQRFINETLNAKIVLRTI